MDLASCRAFIFDLDGCVYHGNTLLPHVEALLAALRRVIEQMPKTEAVEIEPDRLSVAQRIAEVLELMAAGGEMRFEELFRGAREVGEPGRQAEARHRRSALRLVEEAALVEHARALLGRDLDVVDLAAHVGDQVVVAGGALGGLRERGVGATPPARRAFRRGQRRHPQHTPAGCRHEQFRRAGCAHHHEQRRQLLLLVHLRETELGWLFDGDGHGAAGRRSIDRRRPPGRRRSRRRRSPARRPSSRRAAPGRARARS